MSVQYLFAELEALGVRLSVDGERLRRVELLDQLSHIWDEREKLIKLNAKVLVQSGTLNREITKFECAMCVWWCVRFQTVGASITEARLFFH